MVSALFVSSVLGSSSTFAGDGGAFPECHIAQYPLDMGKKKVFLIDILPSLPILTAIARPPPEIP